MELFRREQGLRIDAYAGTGKTTTLRLLAESTPKRGLYLAFNRSIAAEAAERFPTRVRCATAHSLAFRGVKRALGYPEWKLTDPLTPRSITEAFRMPATVSFASGLLLDRQTYGGILVKALQRFLQSSAEAPLPLHVERQGLLETLPPAAFASFAGAGSGACPGDLGGDAVARGWASAQP